MKEDMRKQKEFMKEEKKEEPDLLEVALMNQPDNSSGKVMAREVFNDKDIDQKTRLAVKEINITNRGYFFSNYFFAKGLTKSASILKSHYQGIVKLRPSLNGLSREEYVRIFNGELNNFQLQENKNSINQVRK